MSDIIRGRDIGGAPNDTRFGAHKRPEDDVRLSATEPQFAPLKRVTLQSYNRSVDHVISDSMRHHFELDTPYQRDSGQWSEQQKRDLIRSSLMGLPIGSITLNERPYTDEGAAYSVIDGKQRIETFRGFVDSEFPIPATWLDPEDILDTVDVPGWPVPGVYHSGTTAGFQRGFRSQPLPTSEARVRTIQEEAEIFRLLNSGGTAQTDETMAKALAVERGK